MRIVHYLNQFFGGIGSEEQAGSPLRDVEAAVGPGRLLEQTLGDGADVVKTLICGDNYAVEHQDELVAAVVEHVRGSGADLFVAGPCFDAGRYGLAAGALCTAVQTELGIPSLTAMHEENPGVDLYREGLYIIDSGRNAAKMKEVIQQMARLAKKLMAGEAIGMPQEEGYLTRGLIRDEFVDKSSAERLVDMVLAKVQEQPFDTEMPVTSFAPVAKPRGVDDLSKATVMLITDGGLVPKGNPDDIEGMAATRWGAYDISGTDDLLGRGLRDLPRRLRSPLRSGRPGPPGASRRLEATGEGRRGGQDPRGVPLHLRPVQPPLQYPPAGPGDGGEGEARGVDAVILTST